jgi:glycosyltransferase involved in cell wall biosynthesis
MQSSLDIHPLVSVIVPSFNRSKTIGRTIESIINQQCNFPFEIIVGDDCSTTEVVELLKDYQQKYPKIIRLLLHEKNVGLGANWAMCVKQCKGKYIANCDDDDYWHNNEKLQLQVDYLEKNPDCGVCHTDFRNYYQKSGKYIEEKVSKLTYNEPLHKAIFHGKFRFCNATVIYRKELIDKYVNLDDYIKHQFTLQDWMTLIIVAKYSEFYCLPVSTTTLLIDNDSITRPKTFEKLKERMKAEEMCYKYVCGLFPDDLVYNEKEYQKYVWNCYLNYAYLYGNFPIARNYGEKLKKTGRKGFKVMFSSGKIFFFLYSKWFVWTQNYKL